MPVYIEKNRLISLLKLTQRPQTIAGKTNFQVKACMLTVAWPRVYTCSLVKDGVSSVSIFSTHLKGHASPTESETIIESQNGLIPIIDIETMLGALSHHSGDVTLEHKEGKKLLIKSKNKQTTLTSNVDALAFPHSPSTLQEWNKKSVGIAGKVLSEGVYELNDGSKIQPFARYRNVDVTTLHEALRCVNMNNQKLNEYTFVGNKHGLKVITGNQLKGQTEYEIPMEPDMIIDFKATFSGGLDHVMKLTQYPLADLHFIDLTKEQQGVKLIIEPTFGGGAIPHGDFLLQSSVGECEIGG